MTQHPTPAAAALLQRRQKLADRDCKYCHLHAGRGISQRPECGMTQDFLAARIDRDDAAGKAVLDQEVDDAATEFSAVLRRAEYGDGARMQDLPNGQAWRGHAASVVWNATSAIWFRP